MKFASLLAALAALMSTTNSVHAQKIALETDGKKFVCCQPNNAVSCDRLKIDTWETLSIERHGNYVAFKSPHGYVTAGPDGKFANSATSVNDWEKYTIEKHGDRIAIKNWHGRYWTGNPNGQLEQSRDKVGAWELFRIVEVEPIILCQQKGLIIQAAGLLMSPPMRLPSPSPSPSPKGEGSNKPSSSPEGSSKPSASPGPSACPKGTCNQLGFSALARCASAQREGKRSANCPY